MNTVNGRRYIGSAVDFKKWWGIHLHHLRKKKHHSQRLQRAWNKYGEATFKFLPMMTITEPEKLIWWEQRFLDALLPEYNINPIAGSSLGTKRTPEQCAKLLGNKRALGNSNAVGLKHTLEYCAAMSARQLGVPLTAVHRAAISAGNKGKKLSSKTKKKIAAGHIGKKCPAVSEANAKRICSPETRAKHSANGKLRTHSPKTKEKMSAAQLCRWVAVRLAKEQGVRNVVE